MFKSVNFTDSSIPPTNFPSEWGKSEIISDLPIAPSVFIVEQVSYYRGLQYEREKAKVGGTGANQHKQKANSLPSANAAEKLASQHKVSHQTIKNDAQFARAVDTVAKAAGNGARTALWTKVESDDHY